MAIASGGFRAAAALNRTERVIEFSPKLRMLPGHAYGLQQPCCLGTVVVGAVSPEAAGSIDRLLAGLLGGQAPQHEEQPAADPAEWLVRRALHGSLAVQRYCRIPVSHRFRVWTPQPHGRPQGARRLSFALPYVAPKATALALQWVGATVRGAARDVRADAGAPGDAPYRRALEQLCEQLRAFAEPLTNNFHILTAAQAADIPVRRVVPNVYALGTGRLARWFHSSITDRTPSIGVLISKRKNDTATVLRQLGLPGAVHRQVSTADEAVAAAQALGYPVVVKPLDADQGKGVAADLREPASLRQAFEQAHRVSKRVLVEKHFDGYTHRMTVFNGRLIKVAKRVAGGVVGDGERSVEQLVSMAQQDPVLRQRQARLGKALLALDAEAEGLLAQQGLAPQSIPAAGRYVRLRRRDNINAGGRNEAVALADVHPDNAELALRAAAALRLDFAGIDLIIADISRSWLDIGGLICEVNGQPQMGVTDSPEIYRELLRELFPAPPRIPVHLIVRPSRAAGLAEAAEAFGLPVAEGTILAGADGLGKGGRRISGRFGSDFEALAAALRSPDAAAVIAALSPGELIARGLPVDRVDTLAVSGWAQAGSEELAELRQAIDMVQDNADRILGDVPAGTPAAASGR